MTEARCPEPKPLAIALLSLAGAAAGAAHAAILEIVSSDPRLSVNEWIGFAIDGWAIGLPIGVCLALTAHTATRMFLAPILGIFGYGLGLELDSLLFRDLGPYTLEEISSWVHALRFLLYGGAPVLAMVIAHSFYLKTGKRFLLLPVYLLFGAASGSWSVYVAHAGGAMVVNVSDRGVYIGSAFAFFQWAGLLLALAVDRRMHRHFEPRQEVHTA